MPRSTPPLDPASPSTTIAGADGTRTIAEIVERHPGVPMVKLGKQVIQDAGKRMAQIRGLKPGSSSIRNPAMIEEILTRLRSGETLTSIHCDQHICAERTFDNWRDNDSDLDAAVVRAEARGQRVLADLRVNIAMGGEFSTGDIRRDAELIKAINANIAQRNRAEFGERVQVDHARVVVNLPEWAMSVSCTAALPAPDDAREGDQSDD